MMLLTFPALPSSDVSYKINQQGKCDLAAEELKVKAARGLLVTSAQAGITVSLHCQRRSETSCHGPAPALPRVTAGCVSAPVLS